MKILTFFTIAFFATFFSSSNEDQPDCYDPLMVRQHSGICQNDCPGVCGCDGNWYCNECYANRLGIAVVNDSLCVSTTLTP